MPKHAGGRPSEYEAKHTAFALSYVTLYEGLGDAVPTVEGLCDELGISKQCCYEWGDKFPEFGDALAAIKVKQGRLLQSKGLNNQTNSVITKLMLSANHGMAEKTEQDLTSKGEKITGVAVEFIKAK